jgi:hypothetical protein
MRRFSLASAHVNFHPSPEKRSWRTCIAGHRLRRLDRSVGDCRCRRRDLAEADNLEIRRRRANEPDASSCESDGIRELRPIRNGGGRRRQQALYLAPKGHWRFDDDLLGRQAEKSDHHQGRFFGHSGGCPGSSLGRSDAFERTAKVTRVGVGSTEQGEPASPPLEFSGRALI